MKKQQGFTLIEVIIYLALFTILMGGVVTMAYSIFESSERDQTKIMVQEEGDFLIAKINWALAGIESINEPYRGGIGSKLSISKWISQDTATTMVVMLSGTDMVISQGDNPQQVVLNNSNVEISPNIKVSPEIFTYSSELENVQANFTVSAKTPNGMTVSQDFFTGKYLRK
jgi:prepilin-type N-terminal cleavage/methylation domain-containing protein